MVHQHHWMIEPADPPHSGARCRSCKAVRTFRNVLEQIPQREQYASRQDLGEVQASDLAVELGSLGRNHNSMQGFEYEYDT